MKAEKGSRSIDLLFLSTQR